MAEKKLNVFSHQLCVCVCVSNKAPATICTKKPVFIYNTDFQIVLSIKTFFVNEFFAVLLNTQ